MKPLDAKTWEKVRAIFREIADLPVPEQRAFLDRTCADDPALRAEVESLLRADHEAGEFLEVSAGEYAAELIHDDSEDELPEEGRVPPYVLRRLIGRGGMGSVYLAERDDGQFEQQVALKLIPRDRHTTEIAQRFVRERQILASLSHPHIARLLDGGLTRSGRPYFAMEYVDGEPITRWAQSRELDVDRRLRLFEDVCEAVEYAQQRLVVHRDLKPSNILVDREGEVKLLDFGIAKVLGGDGEPAVALTADATRLMTPEYAAPEQLRDEPASTATDVYALGAVLYELLSGRRPHGSGAMGVLEKRLRDPGTDPVSRAVESEPLRRKLRGDIENILAKAMAVDPVRRYPTAGALLEDLRRYRRGEPVSAAAPSFGYRAGKFVRRHAWGVAAVAMILALLAGGVVTVLWQARLAEREAARAEQVKNLLVDVFSANDPANSQGSDPPASALLARGAERIEEELAGDPMLRSEMLRILGSIHQSLGQYDTARDLHLRALHARESSLGSHDVLVAESILSLSEIAFYQSRTAEAESLVLRALPDVERHASDRPDLVSAAYSNLAASMADQGRHEEAEPYYRSVLEHDRKHYGEKSPEVAKDLSNFGVFLTDQGRLEEAEAAYREALALRRELLPPDAPDIAISLHNLGELLGRKDEFEESEKMLREAIETRERIYRGAHPSLARTLHSLGMTLQDAGDFDRAQQAYLESYEMSRELLGEVHETVALALNSLGAVAFYRGDLGLSTQRFREALAIFEQLLPPSHPTIQTLRGNIGTLELRRGNYEGAEEVYRRVLEAYRAELQSDHPQLAFGVRNLGNALRLQGRPAEAIPLHEEALAIYLKVHGLEHTETCFTIGRLADALCDLGRYEEAETLLLDATAAMATMFPEGHRRRADAERMLGRVLLESGRPAQALPVLQQAAAQYEAQYGNEDESTALSRCLLARCLLALDRVDEAQTILAKDLPVVRAKWPARHPDVMALEKDVVRAR